MSYMNRLLHEDVLSSSYVLAHHPSVLNLSYQKSELPYVQHNSYNQNNNNNAITFSLLFLKHQSGGLKSSVQSF